MTEIIVAALAAAAGAAVRHYAPAALALAKAKVAELKSRFLK